MAETDEITVPVLCAVSALPGAMFWRQSSGVFKTMDGRRTVKVAAVGVGDILGAYRGRAVALETKTETGRLRATQKRFRDAWEMAGGVYIIARSPAEAVAALEAIG
jgi:hypothetical protein